MSKAETNELRKYRRIRHDAEDSDCEEGKKNRKTIENSYCIVRICEFSL